MTLNKKRLFFYEFLLLTIIAMTVWSCAVQQKPQGGPRDRTPPKLLKATPANLTHNFTAKQIQLDFDEYFRLNNPFQEITFFPAPDKAPEVKSRKKSLVINFNDTLQKNTTYVINFGTAIRDVNEGNTLKNFTYVFSTGNHIDSLSISGSVINSLTQQKEQTKPGQKASDVTVMLFTLKQDSLLFGKKKPSIYTTVDSSGNFVFHNLKEGVYKIYALKENSPNKVYDDDKELIAFLKNPIRLQHDTTDIKLTLFKQEPQKLRFIDRRFDAEGKMLFTLNKSLVKPSVKILYPPGIDEQKIVDISKTRDTILIYSKNMDFDSVRVAFYENNKPVDTVYIHKGRKETFTRNLLFGYGLSKGGGVLKPGIDLGIFANTPIAAFDPSLIVLSEDSTFVNYALLRDTGSMKNFTMKYRWRQKVIYTLTINEGAFTSIYGDKNKKQPPRKFTIDNPDNYSMLTLTVNVPDPAKAYVVELLNDQKTVLRADKVTKNDKLVYRSYPTGKYTVRVTYDDNRNGKWDPGNLKLQTQPENIWISEKIIDLRANWELEEAVTIPPEPTSR